MCGIAGIVDFGIEAPPRREDILRMTNAVVHRGPDDCGYHFGNHVALGHRRLSIIDIAGGKQPMYSCDGKKIIVFNGEIYNFQKLRRELELRGVEFQTRSDTEVILAYYGLYGFKCLDWLRGMFAFAIWDATEQSLFIARDRLGKKPLYYSTSDRKLIFGSELKSLLSFGNAKTDVDINALDTFLSLGYVLSPETLQKGIKKLPAATYLIYNRRGITIERYWNLHENDRGPKLGERESIDSVKKTLKEAVSLRMISDVPLGAFLSGGLDSSIIVGIMSGLSAKPVKTFSIGYEDAPSYSELKYANIVAKHFRTDHTELILKPRGFFDLIEKMLFYLEEPIGDQACIPLMLMSEEAKKSVTVMLSGEGADELFGGYNIYPAMNLIEMLRRAPTFLINRIIIPGVRSALDERRATKYIEWIEADLHSRYLGDMADFSRGMKEKLYSKDILQILTENYRDRIKEIYNEVGAINLIDQMLYLDLKTWLVEDLLLKADKMTMAASVELRTPFLDHKLAEISRRIAPNLKVNGFKKKVVLRKAFREMLPKKILCRRKKGFSVPLSCWFRDNLTKLIGEVLLSKTAKERGYFKYDYIEKMIAEQKTGAIDYSKTLWSLVVLEIWHQKFADKKWA